MTYVELQGARRRDVWFVDSGCSNHMCGERGTFSSLDTSFTHNVKLGNNHKLMVGGKGVVKIMLKGINYVINDVYYIPELKNNLVSVGQLQERGLDVLFKGGDRNTCNIFHPSRGKIAESVMSANRMFILLDEAELWHHRYGHLCYKGLHTLCSKEMVVGLPEIGDVKTTCEACVKGKHHQSIELEWENNYESVEEAEETEEYTDDVPSPNNPSTGETITTTSRVRKPPIWSADYTTGEGLSDIEEENYNFVCNPIVPVQKVGQDEAGVKVDSTLYK
uniref:Uncharacterized protein n=1 Tax=Solanum lycopersicum TaxID=4081 RepID=A0A3Q7J7D3_SOLLC